MREEKEEERRRVKSSLGRERQKKREGRVGRDRYIDR